MIGLVGLCCKLQPLVIIVIIINCCRPMSATNCLFYWPFRINGRNSCQVLPDKVSRCRILSACVPWTSSFDVPSHTLPTSNTKGEDFWEIYWPTGLTRNCNKCICFRSYFKPPKSMMLWCSGENSVSAVSWPIVVCMVLHHHTLLRHFTWPLKWMLAAAWDRPVRRHLSCRPLADQHLAIEHFQWLPHVPGTTFPLVSGLRIHSQSSVSSWRRFFFVHAMAYTDWLR